MAWRLAYSLDTLRIEVNAQFPNRDKRSDGAIGDTSHAASASDHNPTRDVYQAVCALDIDTDLDGTDDSNDPQMVRLCEWIRTHPQRDVKYLIFRSRMFSAYPRSPYGPFQWRPYTGDSHVSHPHVSVGEGPDGQSAPGTYDHRDRWGVKECFGAPPPPPEDDMPLTEGDLAAIAIVAEGASERGLRVMFELPPNSTPRDFTNALNARIDLLVAARVNEAVDKIVAEVNK